MRGEDELNRGGAAQRARQQRYSVSAASRSAGLTASAPEASQARTAAAGGELKTVLLLSLAGLAATLAAVKMLPLTAFAPLIAGHFLP